MDIELIPFDIKIPLSVIKNAGMGDPSNTFNLAYMSTKHDESQYELVPEQHLLEHFAHVVDYINKARLGELSTQRKGQGQGEGQGQGKETFCGDPSLIDYRLLLIPRDCGKAIYTGPNMSLFMSTLQNRDAFQFKRGWESIVSPSDMQKFVKINTETPVIQRRALQPEPPVQNIVDTPVHQTEQTRQIHQAFGPNVKIISTADQDMFIVILPKKTKIEGEEK